MSQSTVSEAKRAANARNGKLGGPKTPLGKSKSRLNGLRHGMRAEVVVLLPGEDAEKFQDRLDAWAGDLQPHGAVERYHVETAVAASWRRDRCLRAETAVLTDRILDAADPDPEVEDARRAGSAPAWPRTPPSWRTSSARPPPAASGCWRSGTTSTRRSTASASGSTAGCTGRWPCSATRRRSGADANPIVDVVVAALSAQQRQADDRGARPLRAGWQAGGDRQVRVRERGRGAGDDLRRPGDGPRRAEADGRRGAGRAAGASGVGRGGRGASSGDGGGPGGVRRQRLGSEAAAVRGDARARPAVGVARPAGRAEAAASRRRRRGHGRRGGRTRARDFPAGCHGFARGPVRRGIRPRRTGPGTDPWPPRASRSRRAPRPRRARRANPPRGRGASRRANPPRRASSTERTEGDRIRSRSRRRRRPSMGPAEPRGVGRSRARGVVPRRRWPGARRSGSPPRSGAAGTGRRRSAWRGSTSGPGEVGRGCRPPSSRSRWGWCAPLRGGRAGHPELLQSQGFDGASVDTRVLAIG